MRNDTLQSFKAMVSEIHAIEKRINDYKESDASNVDRENEKLEDLEIKKQERNELLQRILPELEEATKVVSDQERQKKILKDNIDLLKSKSEIAPLEKEIESLKGQLADVDGQESCDDDLDRLEARKAEINVVIAKLEG